MICVTFPIRDDKKKKFLFDKKLNELEMFINCIKLTRAKLSAEISLILVNNMCNPSHELIYQIFLSLKFNWLTNTDIKKRFKKKSNSLFVYPL